MKTPNHLLVFCTCPNQTIAIALAKTLVEAGVAACVTTQPQVTSIYRWQDKTEQTEECLLLIKTSVARYPDLEAAILARHPYELPEIIAIPIERGLAGYLAWIEQCTNIPS